MQNRKRNIDNEKEAVKSQAPKPTLDIVGGDGKVPRGVGYGNPEEAAIVGLGSTKGRRPGAPAGEYNTEGGEGDTNQTKAGGSAHQPPAENVPKEERADSSAASSADDDKPFAGVTRQWGEDHPPQVASEADEEAKAADPSQKGRAQNESVEGARSQPATNVRTEDENSPAQNQSPYRPSADDDAHRTNV